MTARLGFYTINIGSSCEKTVNGKDGMVCHAETIGTLTVVLVKDGTEFALGLEDVLHTNWPDYGQDGEWGGTVPGFSATAGNSSCTNGTM